MLRLLSCGCCCPLELRREQLEEEAEERALSEARARRAVQEEEFGPHTDWTRYVPPTTHYHHSSTALQPSSQPAISGGGVGGSSRPGRQSAGGGGSIEEEEEGS